MATSSMMSQNISILYRSKSQIDTLQISAYPENVQNFIRSNAKGKEYQLQIHGNRSLYSLKQNNNQNSSRSEEHNGLSTVISITHEYRETIYKDQGNDVMISNIMQGGSEYLMEEPLQNTTWTVIDEYKTIADFTCKKATATMNGREIEAWFTSEVPISNGPSFYSGLPGLILEIQYGKKVISAVRINDNQDNQSINPPKTGEKITREVYEGMKNTSMKPSSTSETITVGNTTTTITKTTTIKN